MQELKSFTLPRQPFMESYVYTCRKGELLMTDLIDRQLAKAVSRRKTSLEVLMRFFKVHFHISMSKEVLEKRLAQLR